LIDALLEKNDKYPYAEERRLFYVALTRAKKHVFLITVKDKESIFEKELEKRYSEQLINETYICPACGGKLRVLGGKNGKFFRCSNYREKNCRFTSSV
jgi:DNA helicase-4